MCILTGPDSCLLLLCLFPGVVPPRGGNGKHCSIEQWLNYSISTKLSLKGKFLFFLCLYLTLNYNSHIYIL